ncbi:pyridoxal 5'-phosphate synthase glutaminase subunit PdxT [Rothia sp. AR01]|uniref:Pyridoxal 5'-phosphate synthase subunit PdxT n=1 Tax=Rothia santali TaxID=2949643 RepID=A0A9X2HEX1_9MICC|nr:pyridoxal 5'-phosphate synthase glutaminase subunit PdxT [Rothia santali]MCP3427065.1 pyridoxal 5'-phosphate synthase glutaminase subunit PdxT [Rothia santali]
MTGGRPEAHDVAVPRPEAPVIGVLALQGGVAEHARLLESLGAEARLVRRPGDLTGLDGLVLPGGESSTIDRLTRLFGLREPLIEAVAGGLPVLGTCAGLILLAAEIDDPAPGQQSLGLLDVAVSRNAFGSQAASAEVTLPWDGVGGESVRAAFIRAPIVTRTGPGVEVLARHEGRVVAVRSGTVLGISFHPELTGDATVHGELLGMVR